MTKVAPAPGEEASELYAAMDKLGLGAFSEKLVEEGYDDLDMIRTMNKAELEDMANTVGMKAGHRSKLYRLTSASTEEPSAAPPVHEVELQASKPGCINEPGSWDFMIYF